MPVDIDNFIEAYGYLIEYSQYYDTCYEIDSIFKKYGYDLDMVFDKYDEYNEDRMYQVFDKLSDEDAYTVCEIAQSKMDEIKHKSDKRAKAAKAIVEDISDILTVEHVDDAEVFTYTCYDSLYKGSYVTVHIRVTDGYPKRLVEIVKLIKKYKYVINYGWELLEGSYTCGLYNLNCDIDI
jgi:hypothetical protein